MMKTIDILSGVEKRDLTYKGEATEPSFRRDKAPTTKDVARLAGTSKSTVSRVLVDDPHVLPETRRRVEAAIREAGYVPNPHAQALRNAAKMKIAQEIADAKEKGEQKTTRRDGWVHNLLVPHCSKLLSEVPNSLKKETIRNSVLGYPANSSDPNNVVPILEWLWHQYGQQQLIVDKESLRDVEVIRLTGTLDPHNVNVFEKAIRPHCAEGRKLAVDCSGLTNFNSVCLAFLSTYCQDTVCLGGRVAFCGVPPKMEEIIRLLGLHRILPMYQTQEEAIAFLQE